MNKQLFARFLTLMLLAWGAVGVPLQAQDQSTGATKSDDVQAHPLTISSEGNTIAACGSWDELKTVLKNNTEISYFDINKLRVGLRSGVGRRGSTLFLTD